ncbi:hypothetical protein OI25_8264 (plasmid) [Paraburkholderia fungorum]|jgi:hypothetical protein|uniref:Uncharacterized protein n=1 Tax=Paraburkholderia fungorum TaxID=134537 RepID=A0AAW3V390_9BURK|nr:hypothetical protein OI25_8264 [Paraburkholderia fungorum]MBB4516564.1 hypothetical protein [Paraburkholderia fungorum]MBB5545179.1 hypothetical protein [Paraburkholderia fungorum]MBB6204963.1 hypothetical protein [Paraburkholderia fungorum]PRZ52561.1 hypothetical protein BX589_114237 [Paraburkholderia fungorum]
MPSVPMLMLFRSSAVQTLQGAKRVREAREIAARASGGKPHA